MAEPWSCKIPHPLCGSRQKGGISLDRCLLQRSKVLVPRTNPKGPWDLHQRDKPLDDLVWKTNRADDCGCLSATGN